jgi:hypothetical protein
LGEHGNLFPTAGPNLPKGLKADLERHAKSLAERRLKDRDQIGLRLSKIQARYPQMNEFYTLDLRDTADGLGLFWQRKEGFCTYTRELTVDLPDLDVANLSEQGEGNTARTAAVPWC